jgi:hypothetical protein
VLCLTVKFQGFQGFAQKCKHPLCALVQSAILADRAGLDARRKVPVPIQTEYTTSAGSALFTTHAIEAEFMPELGDAAGGFFRVAVNNTSLRNTRKMAVGVTLVTSRRESTSVQHINRYYQSALGFHLDPSCTKPSKTFVPYAIVRSN